MSQSTEKGKEKRGGGRWGGGRGAEKADRAKNGTKLQTMRMWFEMLPLDWLRLSFSTVATRVRNKQTGRGNRDFIILESSGNAGPSADSCTSVDDFSTGTNET